MARAHATSAPDVTPQRNGYEPDWKKLVDEFTENLPDSDGEPLETTWHYAQIGLLIATLYWHLRGRTDFFAGGNMFLYYDPHQAMTRHYRGPDFFYVAGADGTKPRRFWAVWQENGLFPDVIVELLSPSTARGDRTTKKKIYERTFRTHEYFLYDPDTGELEGWRLGRNNRYQRIIPDARGWLWCEKLDLWIGFWDGTYLNWTGTWIRFYDADGKLVPLPEEAERQRAEDEKQRANHEKQRADALQKEVARLKAQLKSKSP